MYIVINLIIITVGIMATSIGTAVNDIEIKTGEDVLTEMYLKYESKWYQSLTFVQDTEFYKNGEITKSQVWYEAMKIPDGLTIKFDNLNSEDGYIFKKNEQHTLKNGQLLKTDQLIHDLLVLGFNIYGQCPGKTISELNKIGYDLSKMYEGEYNGRSSYFIGIKNEEERLNHFIIDKERLVFLKSVKYRGTDIKTETVFEDYRKLGHGWIAPKVSFYDNGELVMLEKYREIQIDMDLSDQKFDENEFLDISWY